MLSIEDEPWRSIVLNLAIMLYHWHLYHMPAQNLGKENGMENLVCSKIDGENAIRFCFMLRENGPSWDTFDQGGDILPHGYCSLWISRNYMVGKVEMDIWILSVEWGLNKLGCPLASISQRIKLAKKLPSLVHVNKKSVLNIVHVGGDLQNHCLSLQVSTSKVYV